MHLSFTVDADPAQLREINEEDFTIGRSSKNALSIESSCVSRTHVRIRKINGLTYVNDLDSANGTFLNNIKLKPNHEVEWPAYFPLHLGERVSISIVANENKTFSRIIINKVADTTKGAHARLTIRARSTNSRKAEKKKQNGLSPLTISFVFTLAAGYFLYHHYSNKKFMRTDVSKTAENSKKVSEYLPALTSQENCFGPLASKLCQHLKAKKEDSEGVVTQDKKVFVFYNFSSRISNVQFDPSFSMFADSDRLLYLMTYLAFTNQKMRTYLNEQGVEFLYVVDSSGPKNNKVLKLSIQKSFQLSETDIKAIFDNILDQNPALFNSLLTPLYSFFTAN